MKIALIRSVKTSGEQGFGWQWRDKDGGVGSAQTFRYFFDCCESARRKGYACTFRGVSVSLITPPAAGRIHRGSQVRA